MKKPSQKLLDRWYAMAKRADAKATDGYAMGGFDDRGYTFAGGRDPEPGQQNRHSAHRSLDAIGGALSEMQTFLGASDDGNPLRVHDLAGAEFWRVVGHFANNLPPRFPNRKFLVKVADTGNLGGTAKTFRLAKRKSEWVWRKFLVDVCQLPPPPTTVPRTSCVEHIEPEVEPAPAPVRPLSAAEISHLSYTPPPCLNCKQPGHRRADCPNPSWTE